MKANITWLVVIAVLGVAIWANIAVSQTKEPLPSAEALVESVTAYEKRMNNTSIDFSCAIFDANSTGPLFEHEGRVITSNGRLRLDVVQDAHLDGTIKRDSYALSYDGVMARALFKESRQGKIFRDLARELARTGYITPRDIWGVVPETGGMAYSRMLSGGESVSPTSLQKFTRSTQVQGWKTVNGEQAIEAVVTITSEANRDRAERYTIYTIPGKGYGVCRVDHSFVKDGKAALLTRLDITKFAQAKDGAWYPAGATFGVMSDDKMIQYRRLKISSVDWRGDFDDSLFSIKFAAGIHVYDLVVGIDYDAGGEPVDVHVDSVAPEAKGLSPRMKEERLADANRYEASSSRPVQSDQSASGSIGNHSHSKRTLPVFWQTVMLVGIGVFGLACVLFLLHRYRKRSGNP